MAYTRGSKDGLKSNALLWAPAHGRASVSRQARAYLHQLCADTVWKIYCEQWIIGADRERVWEIRASCVI